MKQYTVSFIFTPDLAEVLLVHKLAPEWQVGMLNGVGGKIEPDETALDCIVREVKEETDLTTLHDKWIHFCTMSGTEWHLEVFTYVYDGLPEDAITAGKEQIEWFDVNHLPENVIYNLRWLIPLSIEMIRNKNNLLDYKHITITI
jgi:8-oxo-dGTP diphosphatase